MNFLNPLFLVALAAVAVPLLIHIFSRRRVPEVPFSTLRFLKRSDRRSMRRINLRRLLLLLLRMAAVAFVALAFARPVVRGGLAALFPAGGDRAVCVLLDRSYSMRVEEDEGTLFERAVAQTADILEHLDREDEVSVILFDTGCHTLYAGRRFEREIVVNSLREQEPSWHGTDLRAAVRTGWGALEDSRHEVRELYIISDFQRSSLRRGGTERRGRAELRGETELRGEAERRGRVTESADMPLARIFLVPVQPDPGTNVSVEEVLTPRVALHRGEVARLSITMRNGSRDLEARFPLTVAADGLRIIEKEVTIRPGGVRVEEIAFPVERAGWVEGEVRKGADRLPADDGRFYALHVRDRVGVLLVADGSSFYLEQALSPEESEGDIALVKREWRQLTTDALKGAEAVVLGPGGGPVGSDIELIRRFVEEGGKALVLLLPELETLAQELSRFALEIEFRRIDEGFVTIAPPSAATPVLAPFDEDDIEALTNLRFRSVPAVRGVDRRSVLLGFRDGSPFLWEERIGAGTVVFAAIDPRPGAGDIVLSPYFLPLVQQALLATGRGQQAGEGGLIGAPVIWRGDFGPEYNCRLPGGGVLSREMLEGGASTYDVIQQYGSGSQAGGSAGGPPSSATGDPTRGPAGDAGVLSDIPTGTPRGQIVIPPVDEPGFITISRDSEVTGLIAVNPDCRLESDLDGMSGSEAADSLGFASYMVLDEPAGIASSIYHARQGHEISMSFILVAIVLFVLELIVAQRMKGDAGA